MIQIDSIAIPVRFQHLCGSWYGGMDCMLYAVSSTGGLTLGRIRPRECDTDEQWYYSIWCGLSADVASARRAAEKGCNYRAGDGDGDGQGHDADYPALVEFENWVDEQCSRLRADYGLDDWEG